MQKRWPKLFCGCVRVPRNEDWSGTEVIWVEGSIQTCALYIKKTIDWRINAKSKCKKSQNLLKKKTKKLIRSIFAWILSTGNLTQTFLTWGYENAPIRHTKHTASFCKNSNIAVKHFQMKTKKNIFYGKLPTPSLGFCLKCEKCLGHETSSDHPLSSTMHRHPQLKPFHFLPLFMQHKQRSHSALTEVLTVSYRLTASVNIRGEGRHFKSHKKQGWKSGKIAHTPV